MKTKNQYNLKLNLKQNFTLYIQKCQFTLNLPTSSRNEQLDTRFVFVASRVMKQPAARFIVGRSKIGVFFPGHHYSKPAVLLIRMIPRRRRTTTSGRVEQIAQKIRIVVPRGFKQKAGRLRATPVHRVTVAGAGFIFLFLVGHVGFVFYIIFSQIDLRQSMQFSCN